ncbi:MAG: PD-(D/E)XK nuclease family protein [Bacteroidales bacterium]|nr:PD-(D/E)XK nuclease family protein [Bacteroidales bacterium]
MTDTEIKECQEWLDKLKLDDIPKHKGWQRSLMDITGVTHHENMWSDIYSFFFNVKEEHNMKDLFIRSLEKTAKLEQGFLEEFKIDREYVVKDKKRIDILLTDKKKSNAIVIENKVYHTLNNDLKLYKESVEAKGYENVEVIVLGLSKYNLDRYQSITHLELLNEIMKNIHEYLPEAKPYHIYLLQEFYKNVKNHTNMIGKNETDFFFGNREKITKVHDVYRVIKEYITDIMTLKKDSVLKNYIDSQKLELKKEKTGENEEYVKYIFKSNKDVMLTCFYKRILRPGNDSSPHILVVFEIQNKVKSSVENKHDHFRAILNNEFPMLKESEKHGNIWRHYASLKIDIDSQSLTKLPLVIQEKLAESKIIELGKKIIEETKKQ